LVEGVGGVADGGQVASRFCGEEAGVCYVLQTGSVSLRDWCLWDSAFWCLGEVDLHL
jgi:hypothetical protein